MDVGSPRRCGETLRALLGRGQALERVLPAFTANPARLLRLHRKGHLRPGADADLVVLDAGGGGGGRDGAGTVARAGGAGGRAGAVRGDGVTGGAQRRTYLRTASSSRSTSKGL